MSKQIQVNKIRSDAAECQLLSSLATGEKGRMFAKIAQDLKNLATELDLMATADSAISGEPEQLQFIRADAAECFALGNIPDSDEGEIFAKTGEYLNGLAFEIAEMANSGGAIAGLMAPARSESDQSGIAHAEAPNRDSGLPQSDDERLSKLLEAASPRRLREIDPASGRTELGADLSTQQSTVGAARLRPAAPSRLRRSGLVLLAAVVILGGLAWCYGLIETGPSSFAAQLNGFREKLSAASSDIGPRDPAATSRRPDSVVRNEKAAPDLTSDPAGVTNTKAQQLPEVAAAASHDKRDEVAGLMEYLASPHGDLATKTASSSKTEDEIDQIRGREEAAAQELELERKKVLALTSDLVSARRDLEQSSEQSTKTGDELAELRKSAESVTAKLEEERRKSDALQNDLAAARQSLAAKQQIAAKDLAAAIAATGHIDAVSGGTEQRPNEAAAEERASASKKTVALGSQTPVPSKSENDPETVRLIARAKSLLEQGDILAARIFLERAIETGSGKASFAIAETYDPHILARWNVVGTRGDVVKAREFYKKAALAGIDEANSRLKTLDR